jgi:hypothetical protein
MTAIRVSDKDLAARFFADLLGLDVGFFTAVPESA